MSASRFSTFLTGPLSLSPQLSVVLNEGRRIAIRDEKMSEDEMLLKSGRILNQLARFDILLDEEKAVCVGKR
jgi:hypothetical protein